MDKKLMKKNKKKRGFTLIELLAVILILGIIALIAIPTVNKVITEARINANLQTARTYEKAATEMCSISTVEIEGDSSIFELATFEENIKNKAEADGNITLSSECNSRVEMVFGNTPNICYYKDYDNDTVKYRKLEQDEQCLANVIKEEELPKDPPIVITRPEKVTVNYHIYSPTTYMRMYPTVTRHYFTTFTVKKESYSPTKMSDYDATKKVEKYEATKTTSNRPYCGWAKEVGDPYGSPSQYYGYLYCGDQKVCTYYDAGEYHDCNAANAACTCEETSYSCPNGGTLKGKMCEKTTYTCPNGGTLKGTKCLASSLYTCPDGGHYDEINHMCVIVPGSVNTICSEKAPSNGRGITTNIDNSNPLYASVTCEYKVSVSCGSRTYDTYTSATSCTEYELTCDKGGTLKEMNGQSVCYVEETLNSN